MMVKGVQAKKVYITVGRFVSVVVVIFGAFCFRFRFVWFGFTHLFPFSFVASKISHFAVQPHDAVHAGRPVPRSLNRIGDLGACFSLCGAAPLVSA